MRLRFWRKRRTWEQDAAGVVAAGSVGRELQKLARVIAAENTSFLSHPLHSGRCLRCNGVLHGLTERACEDCGETEPAAT